jgi:hypothetical protein
MAPGRGGLPWTLVAYLTHDAISLVALTVGALAGLAVRGGVRDVTPVLATGTLICGRLLSQLFALQPIVRRRAARQSASAASLVDMQERRALSGMLRAEFNDWDRLWCALAIATP